MAMESAFSRMKLIGVLALACLLLLPIVSSAPLSRSLSLRNNQPSGPGMEIPVQGVPAVVESQQADQPNHGEVAARMAIEVNDYPGFGANNRHDPRSPGRV